MKQFGHIYIVTNLVNGKIYIGQSTKENVNYLGGGVSINRAINLYGRENFTKEILRYCSNQKTLDRMESFYIKKFDSMNKRIGYNLIPGPAISYGSANPMATKRARVLVSIKNRGKFWREDKLRVERHIARIIGSKRSEEVKEIMSEKQRGECNSFYGKKHTEENKKRWSDSKKGCSLDESHKNKISNSLKGHGVSVETRNKISNSLKGREIPKEWRDKISESQLKKIEVYRDGVLVEEILGVKNVVKKGYASSSSAVASVIKGNRKQSLGCTFKYS